MGQGRVRSSGSHTPKELALGRIASSWGGGRISGSGGWGQAGSGSKRVNDIQDKCLIPFLPTTRILPRPLLSPA